MVDGEGSTVAGIVGQIRPVVGSVPPTGWLPCDGRLLEIADAPALFAVTGARFGGDGVSTFALPDLDGGHYFAICSDGYWARPGVPPTEWQPAVAEAEAIARQVAVYRQAYAQGISPLGQHTHVADLDPVWLERQARVLLDGYARGANPLHDHTPAHELDEAWLERQAQVLLDAYERGEDPLHRHLPDTHLEPEWLERQAQVLVDGHARHSHPLARHRHMDELDPAWLERQAQVLLDAYAQEHDPHAGHPHVSELEEDQLQGLVEIHGVPGADWPEGAGPLEQIEGIGPKVAALLREAGISTFAQLEAADLERLRGLLGEAGLQMLQPDSWPEQAALAAAGAWEELDALKEKLTGGRRP